VDRVGTCVNSPHFSCHDYESFIYVDSYNLLVMIGWLVNIKGTGLKAHIEQFRMSLLISAVQMDIILEC
jgi:hypothetical protein